jgi:hypothetical protein
LTSSLEVLLLLDIFSAVIGQYFNNPSIAFQHQRVLHIVLQCPNLRWIVLFFQSNLRNTIGKRFAVEIKTLFIYRPLVRMEAFL